MEIIDRTTHQEDVQLVHAILIYRGHTKACATLHPVRLEPNGTASLGAGTPFDIEALTNIALSLSPAQDTGFLPPTVLAYSLSRILWFCPPKKRTIWFKTDDDDFNKQLNGRDVWHPGLVFEATSGGGLSVWAVAKSHSRPTPETPLYQAPYHNVYESGNICLGTARTPRVIYPSQIPEFEKGFFESAGTHPNCGRLTNHPKGIIGFWKAMQKTKAPKAQWLVRTQFKLNDVIKGTV